MNTKSIIIILFLIGISTFSIKAQSQFGLNFGYGIPYYHIKINTKNTEISYEPNQAFEIEFNYKNRWPGLINFGSSISYQYKNLRIDETRTSTEILLTRSIDYNLNYLYIKAFPEFVFGEKIRYYLQVGPSLSFLIYSDIDGYTDIQENTQGQTTTVRTEESGSATEEFQIIEAGFFLGAGIDIPINRNWNVNANLQYQYGINSWYVKEENAYSERSIFFKLGLVYKISGLGDK